jgi:hypothetical protein
MHTSDYTSSSTGERDQSDGNQIVHAHTTFGSLASKSTVHPSASIGAATQASILTAIQGASKQRMPTPHSSHPAKATPLPLYSEATFSVDGASGAYACANQKKRARVGSEPGTRVGEISTVDMEAISDAFDADCEDEGVEAGFLVHSIQCSIGNKVHVIPLNGT